MNKSAGLVFFTFLLASILPVAAQETDMKKHYEESRLQKGEQGVFSVEMMVPKAGLHMGVNAVELILHDAAGADVPGAEITLAPWMPDMGHGVSEEPKVTERGGGVYSAENIIFSMTGRWELTVKVKKGDLADTVVFSFPEITAMGHDMKMKAPETEELDVSTTVLSEGGSFRVSYAADGKDVPLNAIHSWTVEVQTADGDPVTGATITLVGDMPKHGHGFPTEPEVTEELGGGKYRVEGLKFSMPGWWVVTFHVAAGDSRESASFNLYLR
jgi:hypothetical protein